MKTAGAFEEHRQFFDVYHILIKNIQVLWSYRNNDNHLIPGVRFDKNKDFVHIEVPQN